MNFCPGKSKLEAGRGVAARRRSVSVRFLSSLLACCLVALLPLACDRGPKSVVLATVGERQITVDDLKKEIEVRHAARRPIPDKETLLREMVEFEALLQRARQAGLLTDPQVQRDINSLLITKLKERQLTPQQEGFTPTPEEIKAEYDQNQAKFTRPAKVRLAVLALATDAKMSDAKRAELRERMAEAREKTVATQGSKNASPEAPGFGPLSLDYSDDQASRYRGGDVGWLEGGNFSYRWPREVLEAGYALEKNQVSAVIETQQGVYLVMKMDARPSSTIPFAEAESLLRQSLIVKRRGELETGFREQTAREVPATINTQALATVEIQLPPLAARPRDAEPPAFPLSAEGKHP
jgi:peptidyl-prolyl cis-trans isomerase C